MPSPSMFRQFDFSGGVNSRATRLLRKRNEVVSSKNALYNFKMGAVARRFGYEQVGYTTNFGSDSNGFWSFTPANGNTRLMLAINAANGASTELRTLDSNNYWSTLSPGITIDPNTNIRVANSLDQLFIVGRSSSLNTYMPMLNVDNQLNFSTTQNVYAAPRSKFIVEFQGKLYAANSQVNGVTYPNRVYVSSAATGIITNIQNPQQGLLQQLKVDSVRYIKSGMTVDIYTGGTNAKQVTVTVIAVDKLHNTFSFAPTQINVADRDEVWLSGKKGQLSYLWNTDYPTTESSDWFRIPPGHDQNPSITGVKVNNNRLFIFTRNATYKWDGQNLATVSEQVGCVSDETIELISNWMIWLHDTGIWAYNDTFGQLRLLSNSIRNYIDAINQPNLFKASAVVAGRVYKLSVGQIGVLDASTTSTSTSSTSTSSTSSSTSSTSTSSTSISSTSSSTSTNTTTSTSSTSSSTSSTSTSSTSSSLSTSSTSTSLSTSSTTTTTATNTRQILRLCYEFDMNVWWPEYHTREVRYQLMYTMSGYTKPYFMDDTGKVFRDEVGNYDGADHYNNVQGDLIPFELELGQNNFGSELVKNFLGLYVESDSARGTLVYISVDGDQYQQIGQITHDNDAIKWPPKFKTGRNVSVKFVNITGDDRPVIIGIDHLYSQLETTFGGSAGRIV